MGQIVGLLIFWAAGTAAVYFWLRDPERTVGQNIREYGLTLPGMGILAGAILFALASFTTGPDRDTYLEEDYFSRRGR
ncbi:hypothetical protein [uncultured Nitratireductor sp.]|uniref:hypothetical protein n=1 Tax=uncultured Nitratireductor sp. TaxID=520953 RepID=UPI0025E56196|nr:hypothetical protein [uncultured Nitratireductor sp.]